jgi:Chaperone of endosialidase
MRKILYSYCLLMLLAATTYAQIGFGTATPNSSLDVRGGYAINLRAFTANTTAAATDYTLVFTGTTDVAVGLPDASTCAGRIYWVKHASITLPAPVITINTTSSQTIDGLASWSMDESNEVVRLVSDGSNWQLNVQDAPVRKTATAGGGWDEGGNRLTAAKSLGTINNFNLPFITNNIEQMRLTSSGFLGIGSMNPAGRLHLVTDNDDAGNNYFFDDYGAAISAAFYLRKIRGTVAAPQNLQSGDLISQFRFAARHNGALTNSSGSGIDAYYLGTGTNNSTDMHLFTSNAERMLVNEIGNVGIGSGAFSATPERLLVDVGNTSSFNVISARGEIDNYLQLNIQNKSAGNTASSDVVATADNGDENGLYIDMGINSSGYSNSLIPILNGPSEAYLFSTGNNFVIGNGTPAYDMSLFTGGYALTNERIRITAAGNIGIGAIAPADKLTVAGIMSPSVNSIYSMGSSTSRWSEVWAANGTVQTSDARLKKNIQPLEYGVKEMMQLQPVSYNWKDKPGSNNKIGLIAQKVKKIIPEVVAGDEQKEMLGMNYAEIIPVLINTIKQQQQQLLLLKKELITLETRIN